MRTLVALSIVLLALLVGAGWSLGDDVHDADLRSHERSDSQRIRERPGSRVPREGSAAANVDTMKLAPSPRDDTQSLAPVESDDAAPRQADAAEVAPVDVKTETRKAEEDATRTWRQQEALNTAARDVARDADGATKSYVGWMWDQAVATFGWPEYAKFGVWYYKGGDGHPGFSFEFEGGAVKGVATLSADWIVPPPDD